MKEFEFKGFKFRVVDRDGNPWFVAKDVCDILGTRTDDVIKVLDSDEHGKYQVTPNTDTIRVGPPARPQTIISEPGLYSLILRSRKERAREFKRWVTHEVLPAIRQTDNYVPSGGGIVEAIERGDLETLSLLIKGSATVIQDLERKNAEMQPRTVSSTGAETRKGGESLWTMRDTVCEELGLDTRQFYPALRMIGAVTQKSSNGAYIVRDGWKDLLFNSKTVANGKEYENGAPRIYPGMQSQFVERVRSQYAFRFGLGVEPTE